MFSTKAPYEDIDSAQMFFQLEESITIADVKQQNYRDHAHILVEYINAIINTMFKRTCSGDKQALDPEKIGRHSQNSF